jgi:hypothetical protein
MFPMDSENPPERADRRGAGKGQFGQQPFVPTDQMRSDVRAWVKVTNADTIAAKLDISRDTLDRHFKKELSDGRFEAVAHIGGKLIEKAMRGDKTSMIFYLRTQGKWNTRIEHTGADGGPLRHIDLSGFLANKTEAELAIIEPLLEQILAAAGGDGLEGDDQFSDPASSGASG